ncbi:ionotropic receptor 75a-like [Battus philenor]|uniref:ionotropic receptor 75a-like n=1 Tax=Battus philenor TaxID=42288 RepID=UPI0035D0F2E0
MLSDLGYTPGVPSITKAVAMLLNVLMEKHHFRLNYTIVGRWIGSPERNSTLAVTNSLYWREQDISCTSARIFPNWLDWVDIFFPAATTLETKFFYLIPDKGVGRYENRFLSPMSPSAWWCACATSLVCVAILAASAKIERRPEPRTYAFFSVFATTCQQEYEDGNEAFQRTFSSQGRRVVLLVIGLTSMLLYNYYTSSVVSWLLSAAAPTLQDLDSLINSDLELVFEDIGYTRGWLENPGFFYYSGHKNPKEDELRNKKVINAKRTVPLLQPAQAGIELVRNGGYAYHTEPYTANQAISKKFDDSELCELGALQMMQPAQVYIMAQKNSPYKEFFVWSLMRLQERGHMKVVKGRIGGHSLACSGRTPRALALGQAAPAFALLAEAMLLALIILIVEIVWHR